MKLEMLFEDDSREVCQQSQHENVRENVKYSSSQMGGARGLLKV